MFQVKPLEIPKHVHAARADHTSNAAFAEQAALDWQNILLARAAELVPGGRFIALNFGIDEKGRYLGNTGGVHMFDQFHKHWNALYQDNTIITKMNMKRQHSHNTTAILTSFVRPFMTRKVQSVKPVWC
jgi:hypothetical protein